MDAPFDSPEAAQSGTMPPRPLRHASIGEAIADGWHEFRGLMREHAVLAVLEAQQAGLRFAMLVAIVLVVGVLAVTAWLTLVTALMVWLLGDGMSWPAVLVIAAALNVVIAAVLLWYAKQRLTGRPFTATLRQLSADKSQVTGGNDG
jgi:uncharacterized membrane protein YqjE